MRAATINPWKVNDCPADRTEAQRIVTKFFIMKPTELFQTPSYQSIFLKNLPKTVTDAQRNKLTALFGRVKELPTNEETLLTHACKFWDLDAVQTLAETGIDSMLYDCNKNGETALISAFTYQRPEIFDYLLKTLNLNFTDVDNCTMVHAALSHFALETDEEENAFISLLEKIVTPQNINVLETSGEDKGISALMLATSNPKVLQFLLSKGADPALKSQRGDTALHYACREGCLESVKLLAARMPTSVLNNEGKTPLDCVREAKEANPTLTEYAAIIEFLTPASEPPTKKQKTEDNK